LLDYRPSLDPAFVADAPPLAPSEAISCLAEANFLSGGAPTAFEPSTFRAVREGYGSKVDERGYFREKPGAKKAIDRLGAIEFAKSIESRVSARISAFSGRRGCEITVAFLACCRFIACQIKRAFTEKRTDANVCAA